MSDKDVWGLAMPLTVLYGVHPSGKHVVSPEKKYISLSLGVDEGVMCPPPL